MKFFIMLMMLSTMLFSGQKQIILGSYSVKSNGERALKTFENQIENDTQLQGFMKDNSLRTINTQISGYTVVSLNAFDSYRDLLRTMRALKAYYADAYVLQYPTKNILLAESFEYVEEKAQIEEDAGLAEDEAKRIELKKLLEMDAINENEAKQTEELETEDKSEALKEEIATFIEEPEVEVPLLEEEVLEEESSFFEEYMLYIIALALLVLIAAGFIAVKIENSNVNKKRRE